MSNIRILLPLITLFFLIEPAHSQWRYKLVDNGFDEPYKIAYSSSNNNARMKLMEGFNPCKPRLAIHGSYFCDNIIHINITFVVKGNYKKYYLKSHKSEDSEWLNINNIPDKFWEMFKTASICKIRVNESHCSDEYYEYSMSGSRASFNYMTKGCNEYKKKQEEKRKKDSLRKIEELQRVKNDLNFLIKKMNIDSTEVFKVTSDFSKKIKFNDNKSINIAPGKELYVYNITDFDANYYRCVYNQIEGKVTSRFIDFTYHDEKIIKNKIKKLEKKRNDSLQVVEEENKYNELIKLISSNDSIASDFKLIIEKTKMDTSDFEIFTSDIRLGLFKDIVNNKPTNHLSIIPANVKIISTKRIYFNNYKLAIYEGKIGYVLEIP